MKKPDFGNIKDEIIRAHIEHEFEKKIKLKECCGCGPVVKFYGCREYFVKCAVCGKTTKPHRHVYEAKQAWNEGERICLKE